MELKLWASLVGSAVLMLESGVRRRLPDDFRSLWRAARGGLQFFLLYLSSSVMLYKSCNFFALKNELTYLPKSVFPNMNA